MSEPCRVCGLKPSNRPRGLCWRCYYSTGVRELAPVRARCHGSRLVNPTADGHAPASATEAAPGTPEKVSELEARALNGEALWHPGDGVRDAH